MVNFDRIEKPTLLLDEETARRNIHRMAQRARSSGIHFRPHFKTHQSAEIGEWFRAEQVTAITVSSLDMAEYFAGYGWQDITIAFPANIRQVDSIARLAGQIRLGLLIESAETAGRLGEALTHPADVWLKIDVGLHRTGLAWDQAEAVMHVAQTIKAFPMLRLRGLLTHAGFTYTARGTDQVCLRYAESTSRIDSLRRILEALGSDPLEVSVGDTPGSSLCADLGPVDEIRPGNFVFFDAQQIQIGSCEWEDVAVVLACPIVARHPERGEVVIYGGAIHLSKDFLVENGQRAYGYVSIPEGERWSAPLPGAYVSALSQEHGVLRLPPEQLERLAIGDLVCILPAHSCLSVTLMKRYLTLSGKIIDTMNV